MERKPDLYDQLAEYGHSDFYPFHMPGHKRQFKESFCKKFTNPFSIDITEIDGFDNLHNPQGILKESMDRASVIYKSDRTYYLVNGSSSGILRSVLTGLSCSWRIRMSPKHCHAT